MCRKETHKSITRCDAGDKSIGRNYCDLLTLLEMPFCCSIRITPIAVFITALPPWTLDPHICKETRTSLLSLVTDLLRVTTDDLPAQRGSWIISIPFRSSPLANNIPPLNALQGFRSWNKFHKYYSVQSLQTLQYVKNQEHTRFRPPTTASQLENLRRDTTLSTQPAVSFI